MKTSEKMEIELSMIKAMDRALHKGTNRYGALLYRDGIKIVLRIAYTFVRFYVRESMPGCKKNSRKCGKTVLEIFREFGEPELHKRISMLEDDTAEQMQTLCGSIYADVKEEGEPCE